MKIEPIIAEEKPILGIPYGDDESHIAAAIYLLQKSIALREQEGSGWPTIHGCLRDAAMHCEAARLRWTKESVQEIERVGQELFGDKK